MDQRAFFRPLFAACSCVGYVDFRTKPALLRKANADFLANTLWQANISQETHGVARIELIRNNHQVRAARAITASAWATTLQPLAGQCRHQLNSLAS